eukprot:6874694-Ditylum_brightwellii.AAC.1
MMAFLASTSQLQRQARWPNGPTSRKRELLLFTTAKNRRSGEALPTPIELLRVATLMMLKRLL